MRQARTSPLVISEDPRILMLQVKQLGLTSVLSGDKHTLPEGGEEVRVCPKGTLVSGKDFFSRARYEMGGVMGHSGPDCPL